MDIRWTYDRARSKIFTWFKRNDERTYKTRKYSHVLEVAEKLCDRVGIINKGKLVFVGTFEEMQNKFKENKSLEDLFLEITENEE